MATLSKNTRTAIHIGAAIVAAVIFYAIWFLIDARPERTASMLKYFTLALVAGVLLLVGELAVHRISARDNVSDPLHKRTGRLALILLAVAVLIGVLVAIIKLM